MKHLFSLACMCLFLFIGNNAPVQSQAEYGGDLRMIGCYNGVCTTTVVEGGGGWTMKVKCDGDDEMHIYHGKGSYGGTICDDLSLQ